MTDHRDEWDAYRELGRAGVERARAALAETDRPELLAVAAPAVPLLREPDDGEERE